MASEPLSYTRRFCNARTRLPVLNTAGFVLRGRLAGGGAARWGADGGEGERVRSMDVVGHHPGQPMHPPHPVLRTTMALLNLSRRARMEGCTRRAVPSRGAGMEESERLLLHARQHTALRMRSHHHQAPYGSCGIGNDAFIMPWRWGQHRGGALGLEMGHMRPQAARVRINASRRGCGQANDLFGGLWWAVFCCL